jgi:hypothetical protein
MLEGLRAYVQLASGLTEATASKAREVAQALAAQGGVGGIPANASTMAIQIAGLAEDLIETARNNRGLLVDIVKTEVEHAAAAMGPGSAAEVEALRRRVADLESALAETRRAASGSGFPKKTAAKKSAPQKSAPQKSAPQKSAPQKSAPQKSAAKKTAAKKTAAKKTAAKKTAAKKTAAKKTTAKKTTARKTATKQTGTGE